MLIWELSGQFNTDKPEWERVNLIRKPKKAASVEERKQELPLPSVHIPFELLLHR